MKAGWGGSAPEKFWTNCSPLPTIRLPALKPRLTAPLRAVSVPKIAFSSPSSPLSNELLNLNSPPAREPVMARF